MFVKTKGLEPSGNVALAGPGFRISDNRPILFLKQVEGWIPFNPGKSTFGDGTTDNKQHGNNEPNCSVSCVI